MATSLADQPNINLSSMAWNPMSPHLELIFQKRPRVKLCWEPHQELVSRARDPRGLRPGVATKRSACGVKNYVWRKYYQKVWHHILGIMLTTNNRRSEKQVDDFFSGMRLLMIQPRKYLAGQLDTGSAWEAWKPWGFQGQPAMPWDHDGPWRVKMGEFTGLHTVWSIH